MVTVPEEVSEELNARYSENKRGFGSLKVEVKLGESTWNTSLFYDSKTSCFVLPIKKTVRDRNRVSEGDSADISIKVLT